MSQAPGVLDVEAAAAPLGADAFHAFPREGILDRHRGVAAAFRAESPRLAGASPEVAAAAAALEPFVVEAFSYLKSFEERFVHPGAPAERAPADFHSHERRYAFTLALVRARAAAFAAAAGRPLRLLDVGGIGIMRGALAADRNVEVSATRGDLRRRFATGPRDVYDFVLCTEVIEHITDPEVGCQGESRLDYNAEVTASGAAHLLSRLAGILGDAGVLLLTTPNALGLYALRELGQRRPAAVYRPHYREYTPREILDLLKGAGLDAMLTTLEVYAFYDLSAEMAHLARVAAPDARRFWGDTIAGFAWRGGKTNGAWEGAALEAVARAFARDEILEVVGLDAIVRDRIA